MVTQWAGLRVSAVHAAGLQRHWLPGPSLQAHHLLHTHSGPRQQHRCSPSQRSAFSDAPHLTLLTCLQSPTQHVQVDSLLSARLGRTSWETSKNRARSSSGQHRRPASRVGSPRNSLSKALGLPGACRGPQVVCTDLSCSGGRPTRWALVAKGGGEPAQGIWVQTSLFSSGAALC